MRLLLYKHKSVMKRILFMIILGLGGLMPVNRILAQRAVDLFQAYSWEQASLQAARENKLVLVEVGPIDLKVERGIQTKPDLVNYLQRNVIAIRLNANDTKNSGFQTRLLMYEPPLFAFFMPYGDLLEMIKPGEVLQDPSALRETLEKAKERAAVKKEIAALFVSRICRSKKLWQKRRKRSSRYVFILPPIGVRLVCYWRKTY